MNIGNVTISSSVMNAACSVAKSLEDVTALAQTKAGVVLVGSITVEPRKGNPEPRWFVGNSYALNSFGMPNDGLEFYKATLAEMIQIVHDANKKFALSIAGFSTEEYVQLARLADDSSVDLLELNFGCPNVSIEGAQKPIVSFDPDSINEILNAVSEVTKIPLLVKLSPYSNPVELSSVADVLSANGNVSAVVTCNTFPNGYTTSNSEPVIASTYGGVSGSAMLPIALGQVKQFRTALSDDIKVIGVGGVESIQDAQQFYTAGADMVQCATLIVRDGHAAIDKVIQ